MAVCCSLNAFIVVAVAVGSLVIPDMTHLAVFVFGGLHIVGVRVLLFGVLLLLFVRSVGRALGV